MKCRPRHPHRHRCIESGPPSIVVRAAARGPAIGEVGRHDHIRALHPASGMDQATEHGRGDGERQVGDDDERSSRKPEIGCIGLDHSHLVIAEALPQLTRSLRMQLDGNDSGPGRDQVVGNGPCPGPNVENEVSRGHLGFSNQPPSPSVVEAMPPPPCSSTGGHGTPSRLS